MYPLPRRGPHNSAMRLAFLPPTLFASLLLAACASRVQSQSVTDHVRVVAEAGDAAVVPERYVSAPAIGDELDSLATWPTDEGGLWLVATAKSSHRLVVHDALDGTRLRTVGGEGLEPGRFKRPNGITAWGDHLFVVERDARRVQVFRLPEFEPLGSFGQPELRSPYGIWLREVAPGELEVLVTDSFMLGTHHDIVPPVAELGERVRRYRLEFDDDGLPLARYLGAFGDTGAGKLHMVESLAGDPVTRVLLVADEYPSTASTLRVYGLDGGYTGADVQTAFAAEAEGVALWDCGVDDEGLPAGYWIAADQLTPNTRFHVLA